MPIELPASMIFGPPGGQLSAPPLEAPPIPLPSDAIQPSATVPDVMMASRTAVDPPRLMSVSGPLIATPTGQQHKTQPGDQPALQAPMPPPPPRTPPPPPVIDLQRSRTIESLPPIMSEESDDEFVATNVQHIDTIAGRPASDPAVAPAPATPPPPDWMWRRPDPIEDDGINDVLRSFSEADAEGDSDARPSVPPLLYIGAEATNSRH